MRALFLDRDGVINIEKEYLYRPEEVEFVEGIFDLCRFFQSRGYLIIVVTNQSGIARGFYTQEDFDALTAWMLQVFKDAGITLTHVYHCPHHPDYSGTCMCRKPHPGMLIEAQKAYGIDMARSIMVGDAERDIEAALAAGVGETFLLDASSAPTRAHHRISRLSEVIDRFHE